MAAEGDGFRLIAPGLTVRWRASGAQHAVESDALCIVWGAPRLAGANESGVAPAAAARAILDSLRRDHAGTLRHLRGSWGLFFVDMRARRALLAIDRFAAETACFGVEAGVLHFAERADEVPVRARTIAAQSLFDYLYFHCIPAPATVFAEVQRLVNAHHLAIESATLVPGAHWVARFDERAPRDLAAQGTRFRALVHDAVAVESTRGQTLGCFLSGGTDSSTVAGMLATIAGPARTYSIGFDAAGYDEMEYARIAARHFGTDHHEHYLTPAEVVDGIPAVAAHFDQPFGNSSVIPAFYCARLARRDGVTRMLAGDGGDELFGGNSRYRMQLLLELYQRVPAPLRRHVVDPLAASRLGRVPVPGLRHALAYARHSRIPLPDRLESFNLLLRIGAAEILTPEFLSAIAADAPLHAQRRTYAGVETGSVLNRMLHYDWKYTLADADLPKVRGATSLGGTTVGYPLLADELVDFSTSLPPSYKVRDLRLRWFFKHALRGVLPAAIIRKKKHGFGLPFGPWMMRHAALRDLALDSLGGLGRRGVLRAGFLDRLERTLLPTHPAYYGELVWVLMMLEQWLARHATGLAAAHDDPAALTLGRA